MPVALLASPWRARPEDRGLFSATGTTAFSAFSGMMIARVRSGARAERKAREAHVEKKRRDDGVKMIVTSSSHMNCT